jgi:hypothetical protein
MPGHGWRFGSLFWRPSYFVCHVRVFTIVVVSLAHVTQAGRRRYSSANVKMEMHFSPYLSGQGLATWRIDDMPATPLGPTLSARDCGPDIAMRLFLPGSGQIVALGGIVKEARGAY